MDDAEAYKQVVTAIIKGKVNAFGKVAIAKARAVACVTVDDTGNALAITGDPVSAIEQLLSIYRRQAGDVAVTSARMHIARVLAAHPGLRLPVELS